MCKTWPDSILSRKAGRRNIFKDSVGTAVGAVLTCVACQLPEKTILFKKYLQVTSQISIPCQISKLRKQELNCQQDKAVIPIKLKMQLHTRDET